MKNIKMKYRDYKANWENFRTVKDSYDATDKSVEVQIPDMICALAEVVPSEAVEAYRKELVEAGISRSQYGDVINYFYETLRCAAVEDIDHSIEWCVEAWNIVRPEAKIGDDAQNEADAIIADALAALDGMSAAAANGEHCTDSIGREYDAEDVAAVAADIKRLAAQSSPASIINKAKMLTPDAIASLCAIKHSKK